MPFDGLNPSVASVLRRLGLSPIKRELLHAHMATQLRRHPGSWAYHHRDQLQTALAIAANAAFLMIVVNLALVLYAAIADWSIAGLFGAFSILFLLLSGCVAMTGLRLRCPAAWYRRQIDFNNIQFDPAWQTMPAAVRALVQRVCNEASDMEPAVFVYGDLRQNTIVLDPYLSVQATVSGQESILAIWDGDVVLHSAADE